MRRNHREPELAAWWRAVAAEREAEARYSRALRRSKLAKSLGTDAFKRAAAEEVHNAVKELTEARGRVAAELAAARCIKPDVRLLVPTR